jgi:hypothetical protein
MQEKDWDFTGGAARRLNSKNWETRNDDLRERYKRKFHSK